MSNVSWVFSLFVLSYPSKVLGALLDIPSFMLAPNFLCDSHLDLIFKNLSTTPYFPMRIFLFVADLVSLTDYTPSAFYMHTQTNTQNLLYLLNLLKSIEFHFLFYINFTKPRHRTTVLRSQYLLKSIHVPLQYMLNVCKGPAIK